DGDQHLDLLLVGSNRGTSATEAWYDAQTGLLLAGTGQGSFTAVASGESGFWAPKARNLQHLTLNGQPHVLAAQQQDSLLLYNYQR
ncbi:MAG: hypothetical protein WA960_01955, partial [Tunicatimonas sp.]